MVNGANNDFFRIDLHDANGNFIDRMKFATSEKDQAVMAILKIEDRCDLTETEERRLINRIRNEERKAQRSLVSTSIPSPVGRPDIKPFSNDWKKFHGIKPHEQSLKR